MTEIRRLELQAQLDRALGDDNDAQAEAIRHTIDRETLECTAHTAERLKRVEKDVTDIKMTVDAIHAEIGSARDRLTGARYLWDFLKLVATAGGGAIILKAIGQ